MGNYINYNQKAINSPKISTRNDYYEQAELEDINNEYGIPIQTPNNMNYRPIYKTNSQKYISRENIQRNEFNNYPYIAPINTNKRNNIRNRLLCNCQTEPNDSIPQTDKYYYNYGVIVHKRSAIKKMNFNNNSIHFIKSTSKNKKKEEKFQNFNNNKKIVFINYKKNNIKSPQNNKMIIKNNLNNYNMIKVGKIPEVNNYIKNNQNIYNYSNNYSKVNINNNINPDKQRVKIMRIKRNKNYNYEDNYINNYENQNFIQREEFSKYNINRQYLQNENAYQNVYHPKKIISYNDKNEANCYSNKTYTNKIKKENDYYSNKTNENIKPKYVKQISKKEKDEKEEKAYIQKLIKEKENLEKKLNEIINENQMLKNINSSNENLKMKNKELEEKLIKREEKINKLENENMNYLNEIDINKNNNLKIEKEIIDINKKLKILYLKFLIEKKLVQERKEMKKYLIKFNQIADHIRKIENGDKTYKSLVKVLTSEIKNNDEYKIFEREKIKKENEEKEKERIDLINKRNKLLKKIINNKIKENHGFISSYFNKFYYRGLIIEVKNQKINIDSIPFPTKSTKRDITKIESPRIEEQKIEKSVPKAQELIKEEPKIIEEPKKIEEPKIVEEPKNIEEIKNVEEPIKIEEIPNVEEQKKEEEPQLTEEEIKKQQEERKKINKINQNRRKKLKRLLEDEKKQKLQLKRIYFKRFHFKALFFSSNPKEENIIKDYFNEHIESRKTEEIKKKEKEQKELEMKKEREKLMLERIKILKAIIYKIDRKVIIICKNVIEKWNLRAKLIGLKEIHEKDKKQNKGKSKSRDKSRKSKKKKRNTNED